MFTIKKGSIRASLILTTLVSSLTVSLAAQASALVALNAQNQIGTFDSATPGSVTYRAITGLSAGESLLSIDLRPSNNQIYGVSSANRLYTLNTASGSASFVTDLSSSIYNSASPSAIDIDFNPVADRGTGASLRIVNAAGANYAVNSTTGAVTVATSIAAGNVGVAYTNSDSTRPTVAPASTQLYYFNIQSDQLFVANSAFNAPTLSLVGNFGLDVSGLSAVEILSDGTGFASATINTLNGQRSALFSVNLGTGALGQIGLFGDPISSLTSAPAAVPLPSTLVLLFSSLGIFGLSKTQRRRSVVGKTI